MTPVVRSLEVSPGVARLVTGPPVALPDGWGRVRVTACGVCGTDLHLLRGMPLPRAASYPIRPGHEVAGTLVEGGDGRLVPGDQVVLHPLLACGGCAACRRGGENLCRTATVLGIDHAGGLADEVLWPVSRMVRAPGLRPQEAAVLPDAVASAWHALQLAAVPRGGALTVLGAGGVGTHVLHLARVVDPDVRLTAVIRSKATGQRLRRARLDVTLVDGLEGSVDGVVQASGPQDAVIEFGAGAEGCRAALPMLARGGRLVIGSIDDRPLELATTLTAVATRELHVVGSYSSTLADLEHVCDLAASGRLDLSSSVSHEVALERAQDAFELLERRPAGFVRTVVLP